jgi:hypothetical protein
MIYECAGFIYFEFEFRKIGRTGHQGRRACRIGNNKPNLLLCSLKDLVHLCWILNACVGNPMRVAACQIAKTR